MYLVLGSVHSLKPVSWFGPVSVMVYFLGQFLFSAGISPGLVWVSPSLTVTLDLV